MLEEYMIQIGFSSLDIENILRIYPKNQYSPSTLLYNLKNLYNFFRRNGISNSEFVKIIITIPHIFFMSTENIKIKVQELVDIGFKRMDAFYIIKNYPYLLDLSFNRIYNKLEKYTTLDFSMEEVISIFTSYPLLFSEDFFKVKKQYNSFLEIGYSNRDLNLIITSFPEILLLPLKDIQKIFNDFSRLGFQKNDMVRITKILPEIFLHDISFIQEKLQILTDFGYTDLDITYMIKKLPILLKENYLGRVSRHLNEFTELGFSREDIIIMTCNNPYLFVYPFENMKNNFSCFQEFGFSRDDIISILKKAPILLGYDIRNIKEKYDFYHDLFLDKTLLNNPGYFSYSLDLIRSRYAYLNELKSDKYNDLFLTDTDFLTKYHISSSDLLRRYF